MSLSGFMCHNRKSYFLLQIKGLAEWDFIHRVFTNYSSAECWLQNILTLREERQLRIRNPTFLPVLYLIYKNQYGNVCLVDSDWWQICSFLCVKNKRFPYFHRKYAIGNFYCYFKNWENICVGLQNDRRALRGHKVKTIQNVAQTLAGWNQVTVVRV